MAPALAASAAAEAAAASAFSVPIREISVKSADSGSARPSAKMAVRAAMTWAEAARSSA